MYRRLVLFLLCGAAVLSAADTAPQIVDQSHHQRVGYGSPATFWVSATGSPAPSYQWQRQDAAIYPTPPWVDVSGATSAAYTTPPTTAADDDDQYRCVVTNAAGSVTSYQRRLQVEPVFTTTPDLNAVVGQPYSYTFATNVPPAELLSLTVELKPDWLEVSGTTLSGIPPALGTASVRIKATIRSDGWGVGSDNKQFFTIQILEPGNAPPVISAVVAIPSPVTGTTAALEVTATDDGGEPALTYTWSAREPAGAAFFTGFDPNGSNAAKNATVTFGLSGTHLLRVRAVDAGGAVTTQDLTVVVEDTLTTLTADPAAVLVVAGASQGLGVLAENQFGRGMTPPALTWTVVAGPGTVDANGAYTAPAGAAGQAATVRASGGGLSADVAVTIVAAPQAPAFTSDPDTSAALGETYRYYPTATGAPPVTGFTVSEDVSWLRWNEEQEYLWGTPSTPGTYGPITITATNGIDPDAIQTFSIVVGAAIDDRVITMDPLPGPTWWEADPPFTAAVPAGGTQAVTGPFGDDAVIRPAAPAGNG